MIRLILIGLSCLCLTNCSKPIADFIINAEAEEAPALIKFKNTSKGAQSYVWKMDNTIISENESLEHLFLSSGRYDVELTANNNSKSAKQTKTLFIEAPQECRVYMKTTLGEMTFVLNELAPIHRDNFIDLVEKEYYIGLSFHRVINGFMAQGGDKKSRKERVLVETSEEITQEINTELIHRKGALAGARMPDEINPERASSGTQFYIVDGKTLNEYDIKAFADKNLVDYNKEQIALYLKHGGAPQLDGAYTIFGQLINGFDTLDKITKVEIGDQDKPLEAIRILELKIIN